MRNKKKTAQEEKNFLAELGKIEETLEQLKEFEQFGEDLRNRQK